jgi:two-component system, chemotaxis family, chemotaxis protein CheY
MQSLDKPLESMIGSSKFLIVDDEHYARKVIRTLLISNGVRHIHEAADGLAGIEAIKAIVPDMVLLDWEMPGLDGAGFMRVLRSPETFPFPNIPVIMLTGHGEKSRVMEAVRLGIHEYLLKPVSGQALMARIAAILSGPRPMVRRGAFYGPEPRKSHTYKPQFDPAHTVLLN